MMTMMMTRSLLLLVCVAFLVSCSSQPAPKPDRGLIGGTLVFSDDFEREEIGDDWLQRSGKWRIVDGALHVQGDRNEGIWLSKNLPDRVRVEFDARSESKDGDLKFEIFNTESRHQTGYIAILGGWNNSVSIIARLDEHGEDRKEADASVEIGKVHHFMAIRNDDTLRWYVDGQFVLQYKDPKPIRGSIFGFNNWASKVYFDNLKIYEL
jgi:hypothetical protein